MAVANLLKKATFKDMQRLGDLTGPSSSALLTPAARLAQAPTSDWQSFAGRQGYNPAFLEGWQMPVPLATGDYAADMRTLKRGGEGVELKYQHFSVIMSVARRMPMITACNIDGAQSVSNVKRLSTWSYDGRLDTADQWGNELYDNNILDRGHMVRREDPVWGTDAVTANADTFHFTNACPQVAQMNQQTWAGLENYILQNARAEKMMVNVFTGPVFKEDDLEYKGAKIPSTFWKVVAIVTADGRPSATAYQISQQKELGQLQLAFAYGAYKTYQVSVASVMEETQIDFSTLTPYDGFTQLETVSAAKVKMPIADLADIRI